MTHTGSCHCGKVKFEVEGDLNSGISCNCSMCQRKGTVLSFVPATNFKLLAGENATTDYQFGKKRIHHLFCSTCGVTSYATGAAPNGDDMRAINLRCVDGIDLNKVDVKHYDGKSL